MTDNRLLGTYVHKIEIGDLISNKTTDKIKNFSGISQQNSSVTNE